LKHIVMFSGGTGSWGAARRVADQHGTDDLILLFADTRMEDPDLYRFVDEAAADVGGELVNIADGRDPWEVFFDVRFLGNTRIDPCSKLLKRELMRDWLKERFDPSEVTCYIGIDWTEQHRYDGAKARWAPWPIQAPLCEAPYLEKADLHAELERRGIKVPDLYGHGFAHNNCGGFCIKSGQAQFERLLRVFPDRYAYHERREQELREFLGKDVAILRDRRGGTTKPLTLAAFRERLGVEPGAFDASEWGGCGCAL
jgi:3'-phosphoadenosine 5'-phosphosulfate sulfotransferase (PAPS reductase)/FAD synthetase